MEKSQIVITLIHTRRREGIHLLVGDWHDRMVESVQEVGDGLVGQEGGHSGQQQVDEDEHHREHVFQARLADPLGRCDALSIILWKSGKNTTSCWIEITSTAHNRNEHNDYPQKKICIKRKATTVCTWRNALNALLAVSHDISEKIRRLHFFAVVVVIIELRYQTKVWINTLTA